MQKPKPMILHLIQDMPYRNFPSLSFDVSEAYDQMLIWMDTSETGSEACLQVSSALKVLRSGFQNPPTEEIRQAVEQGSILPLQEKDFAIKPGSYHFLQLPSIPTKDEVIKLLQETLGEILIDGPSCIYLRLLKENAIAIVVQLLLPF